ncbi:Lsr2 family protein [Rhodococcus aerolatus]
MASKTVVELIDDLDGDGVAEETVSFALDGVEYEIDLSVENAGKLRDDLAHWVDHARRTSGRRSSGSRSGTTVRKAADRERTAAVREWARSNGYDVSDRGRIPTAVADAYEAAH